MYSLKKIKKTSLIEQHCGNLFFIYYLKSKDYRNNKLKKKNNITNRNKFRLLIKLFVIYKTN